MRGGWALLGTLVYAACASEISRPPDTAEDAGEMASPRDASLRADAAPTADAHPGPDVGGADRVTTTAPDMRTSDVSRDTVPMAAGCAPPSDATKPAERLSETGCMDSRDITKPAAHLIPYDVNSPLWSDGTVKERFVSLPAGTKVRIKDCKATPDACKPAVMGGTPWDEGHFEFPVGTVLVKSFAIGTRRVETRLLAHIERNRWVGYSYRWNAAGTDATVIGDAEGAVDADYANAAVPGGKQTWTFPSRQDCETCHLDVAGYQLGLSVTQLDRLYAYPGGEKVNQIEYWERKGLFEKPPARPLPAPMPDPADSTKPLELRARAYLHTNCAICHRPGSNFPDVDLRWTTPLAKTSTCNETPTKGTLGAMNAMRIAPGRPDRSTVSLRMHIRELGQMPQIATRYVDIAGVKVVDDWIRALRACPK